MHTFNKTLEKPFRCKAYLCPCYTELEDTYCVDHARTMIDHYETSELPHAIIYLLLGATFGGLATIAILGGLLH